MSSISLDGNKYISRLHNKITFIKMSMLAINSVAIFFILTLIYNTTVYIYDYHIASSFLHSIETLPEKPAFILGSGIILICILIGSFIIRETYGTNSEKIILFTLFIDFVVSILIISMLDFNYNGILFWFFANVIAYTKDIRGRFSFFILSIITLLVTDYELLAIRYPLFSIDSYISYYSSAQQQYLIGLFNSLISINIIVFIMFCIFVIQEQRGVINEVNKLYQDLSIANQKLMDANTELKEYADIKEKMGETRERNRLAREIHDTLGHTLTGISAGIDACIELVEKSPDLTKKQLVIISQVVRQGLSDIRNSVNKLRPDVLKHQELGDAIKNMISGIQKLTNTDIHLNCDVEYLCFGEDEENAIYRIIQESLTNAIRHGQATKIDVNISRKYNDLILSIIDNGVGCKTMKKGFGTNHIVERIKLLNGKVDFNGNNGFRVNAVIPIRWGEKS